LKYWYKQLFKGACYIDATVVKTITNNGV